MEILYILEGTAYIEAGNENYVLEPGELIVFYPQVSHGIYLTGHYPLKYDVIKFDPVHLNIPGSNLPPISSLLAMAAEDKKLSIVFSKEKLNHEKLKKLLDQSIEAAEHISRHYQENLSVEEIARQMNLIFPISVRRRDSVIAAI